MVCKRSSGRINFVTYVHITQTETQIVPNSEVPGAKSEISGPNF